MRYKYSDNVKLMVEPQEFSKNSPKEVLQWAVGGLLYMPATKSDVVKKIVDGRFDFVKSLVLDLEDSLGDDQVGYGQRAIVKFVEELDQAVSDQKISIENIPLIFVRIRQHGQMLETKEMLGDKIKYLTGFNIPKFDKDCCNEYVQEFKQVRDWAKHTAATNLYMMPIIENKTVLYKQLRINNLICINDALRDISESVLNIRVGGADFNSVFGIRRNKYQTIYDTLVVADCLADIVNMFGKSYVVSGPVWEYFQGEEAIEGLKRELDKDAINGFFGKTCIHPVQLPVVQEFNIVDKEDYLDALSILGMNSNTTGVQKSISGRMNEAKTHTKWAKRIISMSTIWGVKE